LTKTNTLTPFGRTVKVFCARNAIRQSDIADYLDVSENAISLAMRGRCGEALEDRIATFMAEYDGTGKGDPATE
jgi:predicted XRE-type DNA-binding protein